MSEWIDFHALRKSLSFDAVLVHYGVTLRKTGNLHRGPCPLPTHTAKRAAPSFTAKLDHGTWQCFACKVQGHVLQFAARMEKLDPDEPQNIRNVSVSLQQKFRKPQASKVVARQQPPQPQARIVNPPLDFELKDLDANHPYLKSRGFLPETIRSFGLGYCRRGYLQGRIAIPIYGEDRLVGYAGRTVDERLICTEHPKYLLPVTRERDGRVCEFRPSVLVYGLNRIEPMAQDLIVVRGFPAVWWLSQWGFSTAVTPLGDGCSPEQAKGIADSLHPDGQAWVFGSTLPKDSAWAVSVLKEVSVLRWTKWVRLPNGTPLTCTPGDLERLFAT